MRYVLIPAIAAALVVPGSASAATEKATEIVSFADLDLLDPHGVQIIEERIAAAVINVCGVPAAPSVWAAKAVEECRSAAAEDAKAQLEARLAALAPVSVAAVE